MNKIKPNQPFFMEKIGYIQPDSFIEMFFVCYGKGEDAKQLRSRPRDGDELGLYFTNNPGGGAKGNTVEDLMGTHFYPCDDAFSLSKLPCWGPKMGDPQINHRFQY